MSTAIRVVAAAAFVVSVAAGTSASASDDESPARAERERRLEQRIEEMQRRIDDLSRRVGDGTSRAGDELVQRVEELEKLSKKDKDGLFAYWGNGIRMDSASGAFKLKLGGRVQDDWSWFFGNTRAENAFGTQIEAGSEFRRARLYVGGTVCRNVDFMDEFDFAGGAVAARNLWIAVNGLPFGTLQVGNMKEPTSTEQVTDDLLIPFLERSTGDEAFAPSFKTGFMASNAICDDAGCWQLGVFRDSAASGNDTGNNRSGEYNVTGRVAGRPWKGEDGSYLHAALALSHRTPADDMAQFRSRPELHLAPRMADTGAFAARSELLVEADAAFVADTFWIFADYFRAGVDRVGASGVAFDAWQLAAGVFLTGETKPYVVSNGSFGRVKPKKNFGDGDGVGTWELAGRVSQLDLDDADIRGGKLMTYTIGVSWYLNPNTRWMLDFVHTHQRDLGVSLNGIETRFQIDF